jgi:FHS family L-fucose permease-like MFS transporter
MIPAVNIGSYYFILTSLFILSLGFSLQQTAANPFAVALGDPATGAHRLSLAGGVNSFGTTIGPIVVTLVLFGAVNVTPDQAAHASIGSINSLYMILGGIFLLVAVIFGIAKMPNVVSAGEVEKTNNATKALLTITALIIGLIVIGNLLPDEFAHYSKLVLLIIALIGIISILFISLGSAQKNGQGWGAMKYPQLVLGMVAIFVYVGVEVSIQSNMGALLASPEFGGLNESQISQYISLYWGSLMIGRWTSAITVFNLKKNLKIVLTIIVPFVAFAFTLGVNAVAGHDVSDLLVYSVCIVILIIANFWAQEKAAKLLLILGGFGIVAMLLGLATTGKVGLFAFISGGLVCSIMWPSIFALSISGLGKYTSQGSSFLIMMILGAGVIPPLQGSLSDIANIHVSYWIPVFCFAYLAFFGWKVTKILKAQGIDVDATEVSVH